MLARLSELSLAEIRDFSQSVATRTTVWDFSALYLFRPIPNVAEIGIKFQRKIKMLLPGLGQCVQAKKCALDLVKKHRYFYISIFHQPH